MSVPHELEDLAKERRDLLWKMYNESRTQLRQYRAERASASNLILLTSIGVIGFISRKPLALDVWPMTVGLVVIGLCGTAFIANHFECIARSKERADSYFAALNAMIEIESPNIDAIAKAPVKSLVNHVDHEDQNFPKLRTLGLLGKFRVLWPLAIALMGAIATGYILICPPQQPPRENPTSVTIMTIQKEDTR